jgi:DNA-binding transcriptional ArsR family regulator
MDLLTRLGRALSDPTRVRILVVLAQGGRFVHEMADVLELGQSTLSSHLQVLRQCGVVLAARDRRRVLYMLSEPVAPMVEALLGWQSDRLEADPRVRRDLARLAGLPRAAGRRPA